MQNVLLTWHSHCGIFICEQPELLDPHLGHLLVEQQDGIRPDSDRASALGLHERHVCF